MSLQKVHLYRVVLRRMWQLEVMWSGMLYNYYQKVRHVLWFSSCGMRQPSFLLAHRWDLQSWVGGVACLPVSHLLCWAGGVACWRSVTFCCAVLFWMCSGLGSGGLWWELF